MSLAGMVSTFLIFVSFCIAHLIDPQRSDVPARNWKFSPLAQKCLFRPFSLGQLENSSETILALNIA